MAKQETARSDARWPRKKKSFIRQNIPRAFPAEYSPAPSCVSSCFGFVRKAYAVKEPWRHTRKGPERKKNGKKNDKSKKNTKGAWSGADGTKNKENKKAGKAETPIYTGT